MQRYNYRLVAAALKWRSGVQGGRERPDRRIDVLIGAADTLHGTLPLLKSHAVSVGGLQQFQRLS